MEGCFPNNNYCSTRTAANPHSDFVIEDLLDFSHEDIVMDDAATFTDSSTVTVVDSCHSSDTQFNPHHHNPSHTFPPAAAADPHFSGELCVPYDDLAELEWLSTFVEDSFSSDDLQKLQLISGMQARKADIIIKEEEELQPENNRNNPIFAPDISVPGKARSKRSRAAPNNWSSRLLVLSPTTSSSDSDIIPNIGGKKVIKAKVKNKQVCENLSDGRRCLHCATDKTPQWRTGPLGPKTLCNACGVRFKSGRLVPEYRPTSSPTFVQAQHSNSHRKVMELRRQKEMHMSHQHQQRQYMHHNAMFNGSGAAEDYLIHRHGGPDYRQLI